MGYFQGHPQPRFIAGLAGFQGTSKVGRGASSLSSSAGTSSLSSSTGASGSSSLAGTSSSSSLALRVFSDQK